MKHYSANARISSRGNIIISNRKSHLNDVIFLLDIVTKTIFTMNCKNKTR